MTVSVCTQIMLLLARAIEKVKNLDFCMGSGIMEIPKRKGKIVTMGSYSEKTLKTVASLRLIDDTFFRIAAMNIEFCQEVLQTILGNDKIRVLNAEPQKTVTSLHREVTLDVLCEDENGKQFNVEVQKGNRDDDIRRCRFHAAAITAAKTPKGTSFRSVPDVTVIYLSDYDALGYGETLVKVKRFAVVKDKKEPFNDGEEIYYVNTVIKDGTRVSELMELFTKKDAVQDDRFPATSDVINYYKGTGKGHESMCDAVENLAKEYAKESRIQLLCKLVRKGSIPKDEAVEESGLSLAEFDAIVANLPASNN